jgi:hypothetical protein
MYLDSLGKATIGIGHLILPHERERYAEGVEITMEEVEELFDIDLNRAAAGADELIAEIAVGINKLRTDVKNLHQLSLTIRSNYDNTKNGHKTNSKNIKTISC